MRIYHDCYFFPKIQSKFKAIGILYILVFIFINFGCSPKKNESDSESNYPERIYDGYDTEEESCEHPADPNFFRFGDHVGLHESSDKRWLVYGSEEMKRCYFELLDLENKIKYKIFHPKKRTNLLHFSFDRDSRFLSFVARPLHSETVNEIVTIDLQAMKAFYFSERNVGYRYPLVVSANMDMLYFRTRYSEKLDKLPARAFISGQAGFAWLAYRRSDGEISIMPNFVNKDRNNFEPFDSKFIVYPYKEATYQDFYYPNRILYYNNSMNFFAYSFGYGRLYNDRRYREIEDSKIFEFEIDVSDGAARITQENAVDLQKTREIMKGSAFLPEDYDQYKYEYIYLNGSRYQ
ncbi:MAG: hypothetical protein AAFW83_14435 [Pseudomonadota bacterium]